MNRGIASKSSSGQDSAFSSKEKKIANSSKSSSSTLKLSKVANVRSSGTKGEVRRPAAVNARSAPLGAAKSAVGAKSQPSSTRAQSKVAPEAEKENMNAKVSQSHAASKQSAPNFDEQLEHVQIQALQLAYMNAKADMAAEQRQRQAKENIKKLWNDNEELACQEWDLSVLLWRKKRLEELETQVEHNLKTLGNIDEEISNFAGKVKTLGLSAKMATWKFPSSNMVISNSGIVNDCLRDALKTFHDTKFTMMDEKMNEIAEIFSSLSGHEASQDELGQKIEHLLSEINSLLAIKTSRSLLAPRHSI